MKTLKALTETFRTVAKHEQGKKKPGVEAPEKKFTNNTATSQKGGPVAQSLGDQEFVDDHEIKVTPDANGNGDEVFKGTKVKPIDRKKEKHGYGAKESEEVNEMSKAEQAKREDIVKGMKKNLSSFKERYGKDAKSVMYATATKMAKEEVEIEEAVDHKQKAKENIDFHHQQSVDYAKEINNMLGQYKKDASKHKHLGDWNVEDMMRVHGHLRAAHDMVKNACYGVTPPQPIPVHESVEFEAEQKYDNILEAVRAHQEEQELIEAYSTILESIHEGLETEEEKQAFEAMLESEDAFDDLCEMVEQAINESEE